MYGVYIRNYLGLARSIYIYLYLYTVYIRYLGLEFTKYTV
jgi:hypothetical protein